jgi:hypothetical protein
MASLRICFGVLVLLAALSVSISVIVDSEFPRWPVDFTVIWTAAQAPRSLVYAPSLLPFANPPSALLLFKPLGVLAKIPAHFLFIGISAAIFGLAATRLHGVRAAAASFLTPAAYKSIILGQSSLLLGGVLLAGAQMPSLLMGGLFGLVAMVKPQLVLLAPLAFIVRRDWAALGGMALSCLALFIASLVLFGSQLWVDWLQSMPAFRQSVMAGTSLSFVIAPAGRAAFLGLPELPFLLGGIVLGCATIILAARRSEREMLVALIVGTSLLASPYAHIHDTIALIPACVPLLFRGQWPAAIAAALIVTGSVTLAPVGLVLFAGCMMVGADLREPKTPGRLGPGVLA